MPAVLEYQEAPPRRSRKWLFYCVLAVFLWGLWGVVSRAAEKELSPATIQVISVVGVLPAGLVLLAAPGLLRRPPTARRRSLLVGCAFAFGVGLCGSTGNLAMLLAFQRGGEASTVMPLTGMFPLVTILLAMLLLGERINVFQCAGVVLALAALFLFNRPAVADAADAPWWAKATTAWMAYSLVALVLWGVAGVLQKMATNEISSELSTVLFAVAFVPVAAVVAATQPVTWNPAARGWVLAVLYGALIGVGTLILFAAYRDGKASVVTALYALYPALTVLLAVPLFDEQIDLRKGAAIVLALAAGVALSYERATPAPPVRGDITDDARVASEAVAR
jgi:drug/metabolite transporter (DMT)-like permease